VTIVTKSDGQDAGCCPLPTKSVIGEWSPCFHDIVLSGTRGHLFFAGLRSPSEGDAEWIVEPLLDHIDVELIQRAYLAVYAHEL
jgi:hypothetical protein